MNICGGENKCSKTSEGKHATVDRGDQERFKVVAVEMSRILQE